jgi:protection of telomeres protein 1
VNLTFSEFILTPSTVKCAFPDEPIISLAEILKPKTISLSDESEEHVSPFNVCKYRANVRVVDCFPPKLEDFAIGRRSSVFDMLSDYSGGEDTDLEEDRRIFKSGKGFPKDIWEWRFALLVEDASSKDAKERLWLIVDNHAAQGLLGLEDDATK